MPIDAITSHHILDAANKGDTFSIDILEEAGRNLGQGIAILINIFNPEKIIISGYISAVADYILESIRTSAMKHSLVQLNQEVKFEISKLGNRAAVLGITKMTAIETI